MISATDALQRLAEGNRQFAAGGRTQTVVHCPTRRSELVTGQEPFAIILGCSDSRVPAEIVFDQGIGDLGDSGPVRASVDIVIPTPLEPGSHLGRSPPGQLGLHPHLIWCQVWPLVQLLIAAFMLLLDLHLLL